ncbi:ACT domain-containing protein [Pseudoalteromonas sp.]|uniref:ACT domain-containing protein n=1 Tax=Pseudoalteromonas sp. TaxID=53249 RepID=UPI00356A1A0E
MSQQTLAVMQETFTIHSFDVDTPIPPAVYKAKVFFIARTYDELSVVCPAHVELDSNEQEEDWAALEVLGPLGFSMTGILSNISGVLAAAKISIFAISTFDTDYILVKRARIHDATSHLSKAGYKVVNS